jgi:hypothetical protein
MHSLQLWAGAGSAAEAPRGVRRELTGTIARCSLRAQRLTAGTRATRRRGTAPRATSSKSCFSCCISISFSSPPPTCAAIFTHLCRARGALTAQCRGVSQRERSVLYTVNTMGTCHMFSRDCSRSMSSCASSAWRGTVRVHVGQPATMSKRAPACAPPDETWAHPWSPWMRGPWASSSSSAGPCRSGHAGVEAGGEAGLTAGTAVAGGAHPVMSALIVSRREPRRARWASSSGCAAPTGASAVAIQTQSSIVASSYTRARNRQRARRRAELTTCTQARTTARFFHARWSHVQAYSERILGWNTLHDSGSETDTVCGGAKQDLATRP